MSRKDLTKKEIFLFLRDLFIIFFTIAIFFKFIIWPSQISGDSMDSNFYDREYIFVDKISYSNLPLVGKISEYKRGDVVVFDPEITKQTRYLIKRIIALPGEEIIIKDGKVYILGKNSKAIYQLREEYLDENNIGKTYVNGTNTEKRFKIPEKSYFVMGDNRNHSTDSRKCFFSCNKNDNVFVKNSQIVGKVFFDLGYFNLKTFSFTHPETQKETKPKFFNFLKDFSYE